MHQIRHLALFLLGATPWALANESPQLAVALDRGYAHLQAGAFDKAIDAFTEAVRIDSKCSTAYRNRGIAHASSGNPDKALADLNEAFRLDSKSAVSFYNRGLLHKRLGKRDAARE